MGLRGIYWSFRKHARELILWFLCNLPKGLGVWVRSYTLGYFLAGFGADTVIQANFRITSPEKVVIGAHCNFSEGVFITGGGGVHIGNYVGMGPDVKIWSVTHRFADPDTPWLLQGYENKAVIIEDDVWLGANCFVKPGLTIGKGAIVSAGTVVSKSVPSYSIVAGNPGRVVGWRKPPTNPATSAPTAKE